MKKVRITAVKKVIHQDLIDKYENPIQHACDVQEGQIWIANGWLQPEGMCTSAWESISPFVMALSHGGENFYDGWMKNPKSAMISCNDGFRPVSFLIEALNEDAD
ncbi:MAG: TIGR04076 family protein [Ruminococcaceae bacterium]|nr:TIGR04076 family protein [Oscillospiraceae bacterium]